MVDCFTHLVFSQTVESTTVHNACNDCNADNLIEPEPLVFITVVSIPVDVLTESKINFIYAV